MPVKILVIHSTSLVGKSTIVASLLHPQLNSPGVFSVETQNQGAGRYGIDVVRYCASNFQQLFDDIILEPNDLIVDVSASQYFYIMDEFDRVRGAINDFNVVIVPTTPDGRVQEDTIGAIEMLRKVGLQLEKLRVLFNRATADQDNDPDIQFERVIRYLKETPGLYYYEGLVVYESPIHADLHEEGLSFHQMMNDRTDYRTALDEEIRRDPRGAETIRLVRTLAIQRTVASVKENLDHVFAALRLPAVNGET
ncbi:plasmid stability protein StbB [Pandoraea terrae]|uniref:Plasmid stability protein StbB n=1 Tax=Pandoraea terrae TaxID=1537710 RepID=A0A5E4VFD2_9BURK|nr:hypothetical protein [Pandoraea terrae]VVE10473.1 plasmid stability protein StbB [Pandoraea terrae]